MHVGAAVISEVRPLNDDRIERCHPEGSYGPEGSRGRESLSTPRSLGR
jgi:hypothetical protein